MALLLLFKFKKRFSTKYELSLNIFFFDNPMYHPYHKNFYILFTCLIVDYLKKLWITNILIDQWNNFIIVKINARINLNWLPTSKYLLKSQQVFGCIHSARINAINECFNYCLITLAIRLLNSWTPKKTILTAIRLHTLMLCSTTINNNIQQV